MEHFLSIRLAVWFANLDSVKKKTKNQTSDGEVGPDAITSERRELLSRNADWQERHHIFPQRLKVEGTGHSLLLPRIWKALTIFHVLW